MNINKTTIIEGTFEGKGLKIAIVASRFNEFITQKLLQGALDCLLCVYILLAYEVKEFFGPKSVKAMRARVFLFRHVHL